MTLDKIEEAYLVADEGHKRLWNEMEETRREENRSNIKPGIWLDNTVLLLLWETCGRV